MEGLGSDSKAKSHQLCELGLASHSGDHAILTFWGYQHPQQHQGREEPGHDSDQKGGSRTQVSWPFIQGLCPGWQPQKTESKQPSEIVAPHTLLAAGTPSRREGT